MKLKSSDHLNKVNWGKVIDYESDESIVTLIGSKRKIIGHYNFHGFTNNDLTIFTGKWREKQR